MKKITIQDLDQRIKEQKIIYKKEIDDFSELGNRFLKGEISSNDFKKVSGGMGVYAQKGGKKFMIRLRVPSGVIDQKTLRAVRDFGKEYDIKTIHLTTREAIQLHDLEFDMVIEIMRKCLEKNIFTRGGGGNFPRNVAISPLSGVEKEEAFDVTPYARVVNKYFLAQMNSYKLPRKFKVAFSNSEKDTAFAKVSDLGFLAIKEEGKKYFRVFIGGSLGNQGNLSVPFGEKILPKDILFHVEACIQMLMGEGDFENKAKARMRFILKRMGEESFLQCYNRYLEQVKRENLLEIRTFAEPYFQPNTTKVTGIRNLIPQKQLDHYGVLIHPRGGILPLESLHEITEFVKEKTLVDIRLSSNESMYVRNLSFKESKELLNLTHNINQTTGLNQSVSCIGCPTCQIGVGESQRLLTDILDYFQKKDLKEDILPSIHISGCLNSCSRHQLSEIGFHCKKVMKYGEVDEIYCVHLGGFSSNKGARLAKNFGEMRAKVIPEFLYELALELKKTSLTLGEYIKHYEDVNCEACLKHGAVGLDVLLKKYLYQEMTRDTM